MHKSTAIKHYSTHTALAEAIGISRAAVGQWGDIVPYASALKLQELTRGALRIDRSLYDARLKPIRPFKAG